MAKDFLNQGILGANVSGAGGRGFRAINTDNLPIPEYDGRYFETFPTVWANAYAFRKELEKSDPRAVEEWATLFLLHFFGIVHIIEYSQAKLEGEYDRDLWLALHGTFPRSKGDDGELRAVHFLQTDNHTIVGAAYPHTVFFPSRGRGNWVSDKSLETHLDGNWLSWQKSAYLLEDEYDRNRFHQHLRSMTTILPISKLKDSLDAFADAKFGKSYAERAEYTKYLKTPMELPHGSVQPPTPAELLANYPLKKLKANSGIIYYLFSEMDLSYQAEWVLKRPTDSRFPAPSNYLQTQTHPRSIFVKLGGKLIDCHLADNDEVVRIKDLFLQDEPFWCKLSKAGEDFSAHFSNKHELVLPDPSMRVGDRAICLAPLTEKFLAHFPEVLGNLENVRAESDASGNVKWSFVLMGKEVSWQSRPQPANGLPNTALAMYPPEVSPQWKIYAAYGRGSLKTGGRWHLIDENGLLGEFIKIDDDNYYSVLHPDFPKEKDSRGPVWKEKSASNRPRGVLIRDAADKERGVLFLAEFFNRDIDREQKATLAMDFGTSNTCLAVKTSFGDAETLKFSLSPLQLWGLSVPNEIPGFVPQKWSSEKGFFPTVLLSRKSDEQMPSIAPGNLRLEHLFKADVPSLHKDMSQSLLEDNINAQWRRHDDLKWSADERTPWRSLFLQLTLLYAHAEVFFKKQAKLNKYVFTFPLAFTEEYGTNYHDKAEDAIRQIRRYCYGEDENFQYVKVDESTAIAKSLGQDGMKGSLEVFVDIGGGTADIAIRHEKDFLVLDSLKIAGRTFFSIANKTLRNQEISGSKEFRRHLQQLLGVDPLNPTLRNLNLELGSLYSLRINELNDKDFRDREFGILKERMGDKSFQRYRAQLFFQHLLTYSLLQACAATVEQKLMLSNGVSLVLGGNGWGLLLFAEWERSKDLLKQKAEHILRMLKSNLAKVVTDEEKPYLDKIFISDLKLLNEKNLSDAKSRVALGALRASDSSVSLADTEPFAGITIKDLQINKYPARTVRWCERWRTKSFTASDEDQIEQINSVNFEHPEELNNAIDETMKVFTGLGNTDDLKTDNMPAATWQQMNGQLISGIRQMKIDGKRLAVDNPDNEKVKDSAAPSNFYLARILYNDQPDFLEVLAEINGNFNNRK